LIFGGGEYFILPKSPKRLFRAEQDDNFLFCFARFTLSPLEREKGANESRQALEEALFD
jgi:hypothetical protein